MTTSNLSSKPASSPSSRWQSWRARLSELMPWIGLLLWFLLYFAAAIFLCIHPLLRWLARYSPVILLLTGISFAALSVAADMISYRGVQERDFAKINLGTRLFPFYQDLRLRGGILK